MARQAQSGKAKMSASLMAAVVVGVIVLLYLASVESRLPSGSGDGSGEAVQQNQQSIDALSAEVTKLQDDLRMVRDTLGQHEVRIGQGGGGQALSDQEL